MIVLAFLFSALSAIAAVLISDFKKLLSYVEEFFTPSDREE